MELHFNKTISARIVKTINMLLVVVVVFDFILFPVPILAQEMEEGAELREVIKLSYSIKNREPFINKLPENPDKEVKWSGVFPVTAYNSEVGQCDSTPCITANGFNLCEHGIEDSVATNMLPFGTKVRFPKIFGDRIFIVRDRMNSRYYERFDIWMLEHSDAIKFGLQYIEVEILY